MRNIFLGKLYTKCGEKAIPRPFSKNSKLNISLDYWSSFMKFIFIVCQVEDYRNILKLYHRPLAFIWYKAFLTNKKTFRTSLSAWFSALFLKNIISLGTFYYLTKFHCLLVFTWWGIGQYVYYNCLFNTLNVINFEINPIF